MAGHGLKKTVSLDRYLFFSVLLLVCFGLISVFNASAPQALNFFGDKFYFAKQQFLWGAFGIVVMLIISKLDYHFLIKLVLPFFIINLILLVLVLIPGIGLKVYGARRWINLGFTSFQPVETLKLSLILYFSALLQKTNKLNSFVFVLVITTGLIMLQPDLGSSLIILGIAASLMFVSKINLIKYFLFGFLGLAAVLFLILVSPYRRDRLTTYFSISQDPLGKSYHVRQVLMGLGSGGLFGVGLGASKQKFLFLPEASTDSIFAVIAEEIGFVGSSSVLLLIFFLVFRLFLLARSSKDKFGYYVLIGVASWIFIQTALNIGSMTALVPLTGVPLPFFSYGGTSLVMLLASLGICLNISKN